MISLKIAKIAFDRFLSKVFMASGKNFSTEDKTINYLVVNIFRLLYFYFHS